MRVVTLLPSATEIVYALGVEPVGVSHECDHPPAAREQPSVNRSRVDPEASSAEINDQVAEAEDGDGVYAIDRGTLAKVDPDVVVNCAAMSDVAACDTNRNRAWATNARAVKRLARHCSDTRAHLVQVSTDFVFNGARGPYDETARPDPVNYYGRTKLAAENHMREAGRDNWTIARTVLLYGTGTNLSRQNIVLWMVHQLRKGEPLHVVTDQWRTPTYVPDLAEGLYQILDRDATGIYHLSGPDGVSIHELACAVADVFELDADLIHPVESDYFDDAVDRPPHTGFDINKAQSELDYEPHSLRSGLQALRDALASQNA